jgi:Family of unknown function (DUF6444)
VVVSAPEQLSYEELSGLVAGLVARVEALEVENAELKRRLGMNSSNSSTPPSKDSIAAKAARQAQRSSRQRRADRKPGGQKGRKGSGLTPTSEPDRTELVDPPTECSGCGADLAVPLLDSDPVWLTVALRLVPGSDPLPELARALAATVNRVGMGWSASDVRGVLEGGADGLRPRCR